MVPPGLSLSSFLPVKRDRSHPPRYINEWVFPHRNKTVITHGFTTLFLGNNLNFLFCVALTGYHTQLKPLCCCTLPGWPAQSCVPFVTLAFRFFALTFLGVISFLILTIPRSRLNSCFLLSFPEGGSIRIVLASTSSSLLSKSVLRMVVSLRSSKCRTL